MVALMATQLSPSGALPCLSMEAMTRKPICEGSGFSLGEQLECCGNLIGHREYSTDHIHLELQGLLGQSIFLNIWE